MLGLGCSIGEFTPDEFILSVGVNDIWRYHRSEILVVLDHAKGFKPDRLRVINESKPEAFYSQIVAWDHRPEFKQITIIPGYPNGAIDVSKGIYKSFCSPYVAVQIAWRYYFADEIHLFGVDMTDHPNLGSLIPDIKKHFQHLKNALKDKGVEMIVHGDGILTNLL